MFSPDDNVPVASVLNDGLRTSGFLPAALAELKGERRLFVQTGDAGLVDVPFSRAPEAACFNRTETVTGEPLPANAFEIANVTELELSFSGGAIPNIRNSALVVMANADVCGP